MKPGNSETGESPALSIITVPYFLMLYPFIAHFNSVVVATKNRDERNQKVK